MIKHLLGTVLIFLICFDRSYAQSSCSELLEQAQILFNQGKINLVEEMIKPCLEQGFTRDEKVEAYKLLSITYNYLEEDEKAEQAVLNLLRVDKEYQVNPAVDPTEFINLYKKYRTRSIFQLGFKVGGNTNLFTITNTYSLTSNRSSTTTFRSNTGFSAGVGAQIPVKENFEIIPEMLFSNRSYGIVMPADALLDQSILGEFDADENQVFLELPLLIRYKYPGWTLKPFIETGGAVSYLYDADYTSPAFTGENNFIIEGANIELMNIGNRNTLHFYYILGFGFKYENLSMSDILVSFRYNHALNQLNIRNNEFTMDFSEGWELRYREPDFSLSNMLISITYMYKFYNPKKLEE